MDVPHSSAIFFDKGGSVRHREIYAQYKANRKDMPEALRLQMPEIMELCKLMGFALVCIEGVEADDLLACAAEKLAQKNSLITIVSADKDFAQLVRPGIRQLLPSKKEVSGWQELDMVGVRVKYGVSPSQIPDFLAIVGDSADNIPGLDGVGPVTAAKLLNDYSDLESIIRRADWIKQQKVRELVKNSEQLLRRNLELVTLDKSFDIGEINSSKPDFEGVVAFLEKMEMKRSIATFKKFAKEQYLINL